MSLRLVAAAAVLALGLPQSTPALESHSRGGGGGVSVNVSGTATDSLTPVVAVADARVHVAWIESEPTTDGLRATIWYVRSIDSGVTFETPRPIAPLTGYASALQCAVDGSTIHLAWLATSYTTGSPAAVDYQRSIDGGETFEPFEAVNTEAPPGAPVLVASDGRIAVVWLAADRIWMARSSDGGTTFEESRIGGTEDAVLATTVRAVATSEAIALSWLPPRTETGPGLAVGRVDWLTGFLLDSTSPETDPVVEVTMASSGDSVLVAWIASSSERVARCAWSTDGGETYSSSSILGNAAAIAGPKAAVAHGLGYVTWVDRPGRLQVSRIDPDGAVEALRVRSNKRAVFPEIVADGDGAVVVWRSGSGVSSRIRACSVRPTDAEPPVRLIAPRGPSAAAPRASVDGATVVIAWQQLVNGAAEVFIRKLVDEAP